MQYIVPKNLKKYLNYNSGLSRVACYDGLKDGFSR